MALTTDEFKRRGGTRVRRAPGYETYQGMGWDCVIECTMPGSWFVAKPSERLDERFKFVREVTRFSSL